METNRKQRQRVVLAAASVLATALSAHANTITKKANTTDLTLAGSWNSGGPPGVNDIASWSNVTITSGATGLSDTLSAATSWGGISGTATGAPGGTITISGSALTIGASGITLTTTAGAVNGNSLLFNNDITLLSGARQPWDPKNGTITVAGALNRTPGAYLDLAAPASGGSYTGAGFSTLNANSNGILGGWVIWAGLDFATYSNGTVTAASYTSSALDFGTDSTANVSLSAATGGTEAANRSMNSLKYGGALAGAAFTLSGNNTITSGGVLASSSGGNLTLAGSGILTSGTTDLVFSSRNNGNITVNAILADNGGAVGVTKGGGNFLTLGGNNTYSGATYVDQGTFAVNNNNALGATTAGTFVTSLGTLVLNAGITVTGEALNNAGALATQTSGVVASWTGDITSAATGSSITATTGSTLSVNNISIAGGSLTLSAGSTTTGTLNINGTINGAGSLIAGGASTRVGVVNLNAANTYTGSTSIAFGTLAISSAGSINDTSSITINGGELAYDSSTALTRAITFTSGKISGTGTVTGITANGNDTIAPGTTSASGSLGTLTLNGNLSLNSGAGGKLAIDIAKAANSTPVAGTDYDQVAVTAAAGSHSVNVNSGSLVLTINNTNNSLSVGDVFYIVDNQDSNVVTGTFSSVSINGTAATLGATTSTTAVWSTATYGFLIDYADSAASGGGNDISLTSQVPEPGSLSLLGAGAGALLVRRRRRLA